MHTLDDGRRGLLDEFGPGGVARAISVYVRIAGDPSTRTVRILARVAPQHQQRHFIAIVGYVPESVSGCEYLITNLF